MTSVSQSTDLGQYLERRGFTPNPGNPTWLDRATGHAVIRIVCQPGEETQLIALTPRGACLYKAMFYAGTPDAVINAAVEAALTLAQPEPAAPSGPAGSAGHVRRGRPAARRRGRGERR